MNLDADASVLMNDFGKDVVFGTYTTKGILDLQGRNIDINGLPQVCATEPSLTYATSTLPGLKSGSLITVDGIAYRVRDSQPQDDGLISVATLARTS